MFPLTSGVTEQSGLFLAGLHRSPSILQDFVAYVAGEIEADIWERAAADMADAQPGVRRSMGRERGSDKGGFVRSFISDLSRVVDGREVGGSHEHYRGIPCPMHYPFRETRQHRGIRGQIMFPFFPSHIFSCLGLCCLYNAFCWVRAQTFCSAFCIKISASPHWLTAVELCALAP